jgi:hypothetical protein
LVFRNLYIHDIGDQEGNYDCLKLSGVNHFWVLNSEFADCGAGGGSGIDQVGSHHGMIAGNYFHGHSHNAMQSKGGSEDIEIRANLVKSSGEVAIDIGGQTGIRWFRPPLSPTKANFEARNIRVVANVIVGSEAPIVFIGAVESLAAHNTIVDPGKWLLRILQDPDPASIGQYTFLTSGENSVINNIFYFEQQRLRDYINIGKGTAPDTFTFGNNLWYAYDAPPLSVPNLPAYESCGVPYRDPMFLNKDSDDFQLRNGSPAAGAGQKLPSVAVDYNELPYNDPPSIGAFRSNYVPNQWQMRCQWNGEFAEGSGALAWLAADIDGDGKDEILQPWDNNGELALIVYGWEEGQIKTKWSGPNLGQGSGHLALLIADVDGDGDDELLQPWNNNNRLGLVVYSWSGEAMSTRWASANMGQGSNALSWLSGDVNGDDKHELLQLWDNRSRLALLVYGWESENMQLRWDGPNMNQGSNALDWLVADVGSGGSDALLQPWDNNNRLGFIVYRATKETEREPYFWLLPYVLK